MKRLTLLGLGFLPLLTTSCGGPIGQQIMKEGVKKFIEAFDPTWRSNWFITEPLSELNGLIQAFSGLAALVGFAVSLWLVLLVLRGHGLSVGAKGILLLTSVIFIAGVIPIVSSMGAKLMPAEMSLSKYAELEGLINIPSGLSDASIMTASLLFAWIAPYVNKFVQMILAIIFCFTMVGVIASASPRGFILAGSWLIGPVIVPKIFWVVVTASAATFAPTNIGPIDDAVIVARNGMTMAVFIMVAAAAYIMPYVVVKTFIWFGDIFHILPPEFNSLNNSSNKKDRREPGIGSDTLAGFAGGIIAADLADEEEDESSNNRRREKDESDQHDEDGSVAGRNKSQPRLTGPTEDDDVIDAETTDVGPHGPDSGNPSGGNTDDQDDGSTSSSSSSVSPVSEGDGLHQVEEDETDVDVHVQPEHDEPEAQVTRSKFWFLIHSEDELHEVDMKVQVEVEAE